MKFSQNKDTNQPIKNIPTKNQFKSIINIPLMIIAIIFTLGAGSFFVVPLNILKQIVNVENIITTIILALVTAFCIIVIGQIKRTNAINSWPKVSATCQNWNVYKVYRGIRKTWVLDILCTYETDLCKIKLTPTPADMSWFSKSRAIKFLDSKVETNGNCVLLVNPDDPLDAYLSPLDKRALIFLICFAVLAGLMYFGLTT